MTESRENPVDPNLSVTSDRTAASDRTRRALVVGVEQDIERRLLGLSGRSIAAKRDAEAVQSLLQDSFTEAKLLIDPDRQQFEEEVYALATAAKPNAVLLIYYSGQGFVDEDGKLFLAAANTRSNTLSELNKSTAIALTAIQALLNDCPAQQVIILDCSFAGANSRRLDFATQLGAANRVILSATNTTDYTIAHKQAALSLYTSFLQDAIASGCDLPAGATVTTHNIHRYIQQHMQQALPAVEPQIVPPHPELEVAIAVSPMPNERLIYRREVAARLQAGEISEFDRLILNWRRDQLGLSPDTASQIEATLLKPHQTYAQNCQRYRDTLGAIAQLQYPLRPATQTGLTHYRQQLGLPATEADAIATEVLAEPAQRYRQHLQQYEQYLGQQIKSGAWLDRNRRNEFRYLEQQLHLLPQDIAALWQRHAPAADRPPESSDPKQPPYAQRLQQYQQFFFDQYQPNRPLSPQTIRELDSLEQVLQLRNVDVALTEERAAQQKRDRYEADLQHYEQELLIADHSPASRAHLQQMQRGFSKADVAIATQIAALLNPSPPATEKPTLPPSPPSVPQNAPPTEVVDTVPADAKAATASPPLDAPTQPPVEQPPIEVATIAPVEQPRPDRRPIPDRTDKPKPWERNKSADHRPPISEPRPADGRALPLRLLKAILFAIVAVVLGRFIIAQLLRILPYPIDNIVGITLFGVVILFAWRQIDQLR